MAGGVAVAVRGCARAGVGVDRGAARVLVWAAVPRRGTRVADGRERFAGLGVGAHAVGKDARGATVISRGGLRQMGLRPKPRRALRALGCLNTTIGI